MNDTDKDIVEKLTGRTLVAGALVVELDIMRALRYGDGAMETRRFIVVSDMIETAVVRAARQNVDRPVNAGYQSIVLKTTRVLQKPQLQNIILQSDIKLSYFYEIAFEFHKWRHEMLVAIERQKQLNIQGGTGPREPPPPPAGDKYFEWLTKAYNLVTGTRPPVGNIPLAGVYRKVLIGKPVAPGRGDYVGERTYLEFKKKMDADIANWNRALGFTAERTLPRAFNTRQRASFEYFNSKDPFVTLQGNKAVSYMLDQDMRLDEILLFTQK